MFEVYFLKHPVAWTLFDEHRKFEPNEGKTKNVSYWVQMLHLNITQKPSMCCKARHKHHKGHPKPNTDTVHERARRMPLKRGAMWWSSNYAETFNADFSTYQEQIAPSNTLYNTEDMWYIIFTVSCVILFALLCIMFYTFNNKKPDTDKVHERAHCMPLKHGAMWWSSNYAETFNTDFSTYQEQIVPHNTLYNTEDMWYITFTVSCVFLVSASAIENRHRNTFQLFSVLNNISFFGS